MAGTINAILDEHEKVRVRHHTGYLLTNPVTTIQLGFPRAAQPQFLLETAMNSIPVEAIGQIRKYLDILDRVEGLLVEAQERLAANRLGEIDLREDEPGQLEREYARWAKRLADDLGIPLNPYSERFRAGGMITAVPVVH